jgi:hypothetical protein
MIFHRWKKFKDAGIIKLDTVCVDDELSRTSGYD